MSSAGKLGFLAPFLFGGALALAVFFQGFYTEFLCLALATLLLWGLWTLWTGYADGIPIPRTSIALCLTLYWIWLGASAAWGRIAYLGVLYFWWLGSFPLVFWIYVLSPQQEALWRNGLRWATLVGIALAVVASGQWLIYGLEPVATFLNRNSLAALFNLIALPLCGYFLISSGTEARRRRWVLGTAVLVLAFGVALIEGRGAIISGGLALLLLAGVAWKFVSRRSVIQLAAIVLAALALAALTGRLGVGQRLETMIGNPYEVGSERLVIWKQSWQMFKHAPWMGVGLGHYSLYWPPYRIPSDGSAGFFVHNDYLQILVEAGILGLVFLVAVLVSVLIAYVRTLRDRTMSPSRKVEITALFAGLLAVAMHSFVDFNLYILAILILAGLVLGRLHALVYSGRDAAMSSFVPAKFMTVRGYRTLIVLVTVLALSYFVTLGLASFEYRRGLNLAADAKSEQAYAAFERAARYFPYADNILLSKADLLRNLISVLPESSIEQRTAMFNEAQDSLARAEDLNPLRPQIFATRAVLYDNNPRLAGTDGQEQAERNYRRAIELEPRAYQARYLLATFLLKQKRLDEARRVLEDGMKYVYFPTELILPYYSLTAKLRLDAGDRDGAADVRSRIEEIESSARAQSLTRKRGTIKN